MVGLAYTDLGGRFVEANRKLCELLGYTADELRTLDDIPVDTSR